MFAFRPNIHVCSNMSVSGKISSHIGEVDKVNGANIRCFHSPYRDSLDDKFLLVFVLQTSTSFWLIMQAQCLGYLIKLATTLVYYEANNTKIFSFNNLMFVFTMHKLHCCKYGSSVPMVLCKKFSIFSLISMRWSGTVHGWWVPGVIWPKFFLEVC